MSPGPELDRLIAEKVMGWNHYAQFPGECQFMDDHEGCWWETKTSGQPVADLSWSPSTDWRAAGEVLTHVTNALTVDGIVPEWEVRSPRENLGGHFRDSWWVDIGIPRNPKDGDWEHFTASGESFPHAICLAALRAKGVEV